MTVNIDEPSSRYLIRSLAAHIFCLCSLGLWGQGIRGLVTDDQGQPLVQVNIFVKELQSGTSTDEQGAFYLTLDPGHYEVVFSSLGYLSKVLPIVAGESIQDINVSLRLSDLKLNEIVVKAKQKDAAYEIIRNVIRNKKKY